MIAIGADRLGHHFLRRRQRHVRIVAFNAVDIPLQACEIDNVAVMIMADMLLVGIGEGLNGLPWPMNPAGRREL